MRRGAETVLLDAGGCGGCAAEVEAFLRRGGGAGLPLSKAGSPMQAELMLVAGCVTRSMREAVSGCRKVMADEVPVVAVGDCAIDGGVFRGGYAVAGGLDDVLRPTAVVTGCPPSPDAIAAALRGLLAPEPAIGSVTLPEEPVEAAAVPGSGPARLPPAPRRRLGDADSSER